MKLIEPVDDVFEWLAVVDRVEEEDGGCSSVEVGSDWFVDVLAGLG